jgi:hypothetical protein
MVDTGGAPHPLAFCLVSSALAAAVAEGGHGNGCVGGPVGEAGY